MVMGKRGEFSSSVRYSLAPLLLLVCLKGFEAGSATIVV